MKPSSVRLGQVVEGLHADDLGDCLSLRRLRWSDITQAELTNQPLLLEFGEYGKRFFNGSLRRLQHSPNANIEDVEPALIIKLIYSDALVESRPSLLCHTLQLSIYRVRCGLKSALVESLPALSSYRPIDSYPWGVIRWCSRQRWDSTTTALCRIS